MVDSGRWPISAAGTLQLLCWSRMLPGHCDDMALGACSSDKGGCLVAHLVGGNPQLAAGAGGAGGQHAVDQLKELLHHRVLPQVVIARLDLQRVCVVSGLLDVPWAGCRGIGQRKRVGRGGAKGAAALYKGRQASLCLTKGQEPAQHYAPPGRCCVVLWRQRSTYLWV